MCIPGVGGEVVEGSQGMLVEPCARDGESTSELELMEDLQVSYSNIFRVTRWQNNKIKTHKPNNFI